MSDSSFAPPSVTSGRWRTRRNAWSARLTQSTIAIPLAGIAAVGVIAGGFAAGLPADWQAALSIGALLAAGAIGISSPILARARRELDSARQLLDLTVDELAQVNDDLRRTAAARDRALVDLQASMEERQRFFDSIAHELNTPLTVINGHVQILAGRLNKSEPLDREQMSRGVNRMTSSIHQLTGLVDEFLWLARLDINEPVHLDRQPVELIALARSVVEEYSAATSHQIRMNATMDEMTGHWDARRLRRAIGNLLSNAIQYSPTGGAVEVTIGAESDGSAVFIAVRDEGIGITAEELPHLFERFYRGDRAVSMGAGVGLGLASVKHTVDAHGGTVSVESRVGRGSTFTIRLPREEGVETA